MYVYINKDNLDIINMNIQIKRGVLSLVILIALYVRSDFNKRDEPRILNTSVTACSTIFSTGDICYSVDLIDGHRQV